VALPEDLAELTRIPPCLHRVPRRMDSSHLICPFHVRGIDSVANFKWLDPFLDMGERINLSALRTFFQA
jgi:hypothetical protein